MPSPLVHLSRVLCPEGSVRRVWRGPAKGLRVRIEPGIGLSYVLGRPAAAPPFFSSVVRPGMTVVDVGANKGQMALIFAALVGRTGRVFAWEPAPAEFASLCRNLDLNDLRQVVPVRAAAADKDGTVLFTYDATRPTQGKVADVEPSYLLGGESTSLQVEARPLDWLVDEGVAPDLLKIDAEGSAAIILKGAARLLDRYSPAVFIELHGPDEQRGVLDHLVRRGYVAHTPNGDEVPDPTAGWFSALWLTRSRATTTVVESMHD